MEDHPAAPHNGALPAGAPAGQITHPKKRGFLAAFSTCGQVTKAARAVGIEHSQHYYWLKTDVAYATAFADAQAMAATALEDEAIRRAREGVKRIIFHQGEPVGEELQYSDVLLIFLLKGMLPQKYGNAKADREQRESISDLLTAVLLEMRDRDQPRNVTPTAEWAPGAALPAPPAPDEHA